MASQLEKKLANVNKTINALQKAKDDAEAKKKQLIEEYNAQIAETQEQITAYQRAAKRLEVAIENEKLLLDDESLLAASVNLSKKKKKKAEPKAEEEPEQEVPAEEQAEEMAEEQEVPAEEPEQPAEAEAEEEPEPVAQNMNSSRFPNFF